MRPLARHNDRLRRLRRLVTDRRSRDSEGVVVVEGPHAIATAIDAGAAVDAIYVADDTDLPGLGLAEFSGPDAPEMFVVERSLLDDIADSGTPQGVLATAAAPSGDLADIVATPRVVVLDAIQDPGNAGAIVRTAVAFGFTAVVATVGCADLWSPRAIRASAGTIFAASVLRRADPTDVLEALGAAGHLRVTTSADADRDLTELALTPQMALVMGSEAHGVSPEAAAACDVAVSIGMRAPVESLNVAVTAALAMHHLQG